MVIRSVELLESGGEAEVYPEIWRPKFTGEAACLNRKIDQN